MHLRMKYTVENSYSFQIGDAIREAIYKPWKIPLLPISILKRHRKIKKKKMVSESEKECLFIIDYHRFTPKERNMLNPFFSSVSNSIVFLISDELSEGGTHHFPPITSTNKSNQAWNADLEYVLEAILVSAKPEKLVFIGQYPYAGIASILRKLEPKSNTAWIPLHAKEETIKQRAERFGKVLDWPEDNTQHLPWNRNHVFVSRLITGEALKSIKKYMQMFNLEHGTRESSRLNILHQSEGIDNHTLLTNGVVITRIYENEEEMIDEISNPSNQFQLFTDDLTIFDHQLKPLLESVANNVYSGPNTSFVREEAWIEIYSSFGE